MITQYIYIYNNIHIACWVFVGGYYPGDYYDVIIGILINKRAGDDNGLDEPGEFPRTVFPRSQHIFVK